MSEVRTRQTYGGTGTDLVIRLTAEEARVLGGDAEDLARWLSDVLDALAGLRSGRWAGDSAAARDGAYQAINAAHTRLAPRLRGVVDAAVRAHRAAGGSVRHLAAALDAAHPSGAQYRRDALPDRPGAWETWATGPHESEEDGMGREIIRATNVAHGNARVGDQIGQRGIRQSAGQLWIDGRLQTCPKSKRDDCWTSARVEHGTVRATCRCGCGGTWDLS